MEKKYFSMEMVANLQNLLRAKHEAALECGKCYDEYRKYLENNTQYTTALNSDSPFRVALEKDRLVLIQAGTCMPVLIQVARLQETLIKLTEASIKAEEAYKAATLDFLGTWRTMLSNL